MAVVLDLETTGLDPEIDEVLEVGIVGTASDIVLSSLVRPRVLTDWDDAQMIHGISPEDVAGAPLLSEIADQIRDAVAGEVVVIFNRQFDTDFLGDLLDGAAEVRCAMLEFTEYRGSTRWISLARAAEYILFEWPNAQHRAVTDACATLAVWRYLHDPEERQRVTTQKKAIADQNTADRYNRDYYWLKTMRDQQMGFRQSEIIRRFWLRSGANIRHWTSVCSSAAEEYAELFYGQSLSSLELSDRTSAAGLPVFTKKAQIPDRLKPISFFPARSWLRAELQFAGAFCSKKSAYELYDVSELERLRAKHPLRVSVSPPQRGVYWVPKSQLKKAGVSAKRIDQLEPVAEVQNRIYNNWYLLYEVSATVNADLLSKIKKLKNDQT